MNIKRPLVWILAAYLAGLAMYTIEFNRILLIGIASLLLILIWMMFPVANRRKKFIHYYFLLILPFLFLLGHNRMKLALAGNALDLVFDNEIKGEVTGQLAMLQDKGDYQVLTLTDNTIQLKQEQRNKIHLRQEKSNQTQLTQIQRNQTQQNQTQLTLTQQTQTQLTQSQRNQDTYFTKKLTVYTSSDNQYKIGNILSISGKIIKFQKASDPGQFNEYQYNKMLQIDYKVNADTIKLINEDYSVFYQTLYTIKERFIHIYQQILPPKNAGILSAMILGEMSLLEPDMKELYQQSGISHILAISGLHISLLGLSLYRLLRRLQVPVFLNAVISIFIICSYGILTNFSVSTNRAVVMLIVLMSAGIVGRTYDLLSATALSALIILMQSPLQMGNAGFLLSFGAIMGMALLNPLLTLLFPLKNKLWEGLKTSISIQIITLPIILYFFYDFPTYSIIINMIILPSSTIIILLAILAGAAAGIWLPLGTFLIGGVHYLLNFYEVVCRIAATLPGKTFLVGRPEPFSIIAYYSILVLLILFYKKLNRKFCILLLSFLLIIFVKSHDLSLKVEFLDVGQGDGIFMSTPTKTTYLIDGGSSDVSKVGIYRLKPYLKVNGIGYIDYAVVTHMDSDHISGLKELIEAMEDRNTKYLTKSKQASKPERYKGNIVIRNLILPDILEKDDTYKELEALALSKGINVLHIQKGDTIKDGEVTITCLHPYADVNYNSRNAYSTVLSVTYKDFDLLLTGDLEEEGETLVVNELKKLAEKPSSESKINKYNQTARKYDILKVAHHGSNNSSFEEFLKLVAPEYSIISCGKDNSYGHPGKELIKRLNRIDSDVIITYESGAVTVKTDGKRMEIKEYLKD
jgi:competence protein ComEC